MWAVLFVTAVHGKVSLHSMVTPPIQMANLGMADSLILMVMALVVFGPRRLPQIGRQIGKLMYEFRKASNDFKFQMEEELRSSEEADRRKKEEERQRALAETPVVKVSATEAVAPLVAESQPQTIEETVPAAGLELPSPDDGVYPALTDPALTDPTLTDPALTGPTLPPPADERTSSAGIPGEEPHLRIMPPSIGEQVPAARPNSHAVQADLFAEPSVDAAAKPDSETPQAAHHG